jgi:hypothetical protein
MSSYFRKTKDWSGEVLGAEKFAARINRIKEKDYDKYKKEENFFCMIFIIRLDM